MARLATRIAAAKRRLDPAAVNRQIGRILQQNQRAAARFEVRLQGADCPAGFQLKVETKPSFDEWADLSEGAYLLRSNGVDIAIPDHTTLSRRGVGLTEVGQQESRSH